MKVPKRADYPKTADEATQAAVEWQSWQSENSLSLGIIVEWQNYFSELATKYGLTEEFAENGII